jgi:hypothetical protein
MSKTAEGEWCADRDPAAKSTVQKIKIKEILYLKEVLLPTMKGVYHHVYGVRPRNMHPSRGYRATAAWEVRD